MQFDNHNSLRHFFSNIQTTEVLLLSFIIFDSTQTPQSGANVAVPAKVSEPQSGDILVEKDKKRTKLRRSDI